MTEYDFKYVISLPEIQFDNIIILVTIIAIVCRIIELQREYLNDIERRNRAPERLQGNIQGCVCNRNSCYSVLLMMHL